MPNPPENAAPEPTSDCQALDAKADNGSEFKKPGELAFTLILLLLSGTAVFLSYDISGLESISAPGVIPVLASITMLVACLVMTRRVWCLPNKASQPSLAVFLAPTILINFIILGGLYVVALTQIGFIAATIAYLFVSVLYLHRQGWLLAAFVSLNALAVIYIVFRLAFKIILPEGALI